jgi:hypothetical protein
MMLDLLITHTPGFIVGACTVIVLLIVYATVHSRPADSADIDGIDQFR